MKSIYRSKILDYIKKYPIEKRTTIANLIAEEFGHFDKIEKIRSLVRYYSGVNGKKNYNSVKNNNVVKEYRQRLSMPLPIEYTDYSPKKFTFNKVLVLADLHIKDHDNKALDLALSYSKDKGIEAVILLGDVIDGYMISKFTQDPNKPSFFEELETCKYILRYISQELPKTKIIYKAGNHDGMRLQNYIYRNAVKLAELEDLKLENLLKLKEYNISYVPDMQLIKIGKLLFAHGHEFGGNPSVNIARCIYNKVLQNVIFGHFHRKEEYIDVNIVTRETKGSYAIGCMSNTQPDYRPYSKYQLGFAIVDFKNDGNFKVDNRLIINGTIV